VIEMKVAGIAIDAISRSPIVLLRDGTDRRALPIWIGEAEARAIVAALDPKPTPRPMTHDLCLTMMEMLGAEIERIVVHDLRNSTFFATIVLRHEDEKIEIDARPSDAIALALRAKCSIWVMEEVVLEASVPVDRDADEAERRAFREFLAGVKPGDFRKHDSPQANEG